jgi:drug/metabolite transporter (DMT)-like permease
VKRHWLAVVTLLLVAAAWGATFALVKDILRDIAPEPFIFFRFTLAGLVLCAIAIQQKRLRRDVFASGALLGGLVFVGYLMQTHALMKISPSRSAFLTGLYVVLVPFCDRILRRRHVPLQAWAACVLAIAGTGALIGGFNAHPSRGDLLTLGCALCFALHVIYTAEFTARHSAIGLAAVQVLVVGLAAAPASVFAPRPVASRTLVIVILFTSLVTTALAFVGLMWGQARVTATEAAVILSFEPVAASITSIGWYGESITRSVVLGGGLILMAMFVSQLGGQVEAH